MKVVVKRDFLHDKMYTEHEIAEFSESVAKDLEKNGLILPLVPGMIGTDIIGEKTVRKAMMGTGVPLSEVDPTPARPPGGQTGAEKPASSLEAVPQQTKRTYRRRRAARE